MAGAGRCARSPCQCGIGNWSLSVCVISGLPSAAQQSGPARGTEEMGKGGESHYWRTGAPAAVARATNCVSGTRTCGPYATPASQPSAQARDTLAQNCSIPTCAQRHSATAVSRPFLPQISPIFRHFSPVLSVSAPGSRTAQTNGGKTAENGRETAEKQWAKWRWDTTAAAPRDRDRLPSKESPTSCAS